MTENQKQLAVLAGALKAQIESQFNAEVGEFDAAITEGYNAEQARLNGAKATPVDFVDSGLNIAKGIATEVGNPKVITLVDDFSQTADDALKGKYLALFGDALKDFHDIKLAVKK